MTPLTLVEPRHRDLRESLGNIERVLGSSGRPATHAAAGKRARWPKGADRTKRASPSPSPSGQRLTLFLSQRPRGRTWHRGAAHVKADGVARVARGRSGGRVRDEGRGRHVGGIRPHPLARPPRVDEELLHDARILDRRQQAHSVAALRAGEDVNIEGVPHQPAAEDRPLQRRSARPCLVARHHGFLSLTSSKGAVYGKPGTRPTPACSTRGPIPASGPSSYRGACMTWSCTMRWI